MLDEVDKLGHDFRGDPASALLEVLDPEQNATFRDHYLDVAFDLSRVLFITTANQLDPIPPALLDRMEVIHLAGYTEEEKREIARRHLCPKQTAEHGLAVERDIAFTDEALRFLVRSYTREAGVRSLEREIATLCRKVARRRAEGHTEPVAITPAEVIGLLGAPRFLLEEELDERTRVPRRGDRPRLDAGRWRPALHRGGSGQGREVAHPHRPARRRDEGVRPGGRLVGARARRRPRRGRRLLG
jgi:ATP-dependent Lon protease